MQRIRIFQLSLLCLLAQRSIEAAQKQMHRPSMWDITESDKLYFLECALSNFEHHARIVKFFIEEFGSGILGCQVIKGKPRGDFVRIGNAIYEYALEQDSIAHIKMLIQHDSGDSKRILFDAVRWSNEKTVKYLIEECKVDITECGALLCQSFEKINEQRGWCDWGKWDAVLKELISNGFDINTKNTTLYSNGNTALMTAAYRASVGIIKRLIALNADVNAQNKEGITALMYAVDNYHMDNFDVDMVRLLLDARADVTLRDKQNRTVLTIATVRKDLERRPVLYDLPSAESPVALECRNKIINMLLQNGADPDDSRAWLQKSGQSFSESTEKALQEYYQEWFKQHGKAVLPIVAECISNHAQETGIDDSSADITENIIAGYLAS